ncbi:efflux RND transporter permease subunit [Kiritimatiellaeota bacterium B1221]|nr:efflux RND transporter permease subunit [Kiritimatiellaeota bacterium B1221]
MNTFMKAAKGPIAWMVKNPVAANLLMALFLVGGVASFSTLTQEVMPDITTDMVTISISYSGGTPEEMEQSVCLVVEEAVRGLEGIEEVTSVASEGSATISAELMEGVDRVKVYQDIKSEIDRITTFPDGAESPVVALAARKRDVMSLVLFGETSEMNLRNLAEQVRDRLLQSEGITQVELTGTRDLEISIEVSQEELRRYNLDHAGLAASIKTQSREISGGGIKTDSGETLLRMQERRDYGVDFAEAPVLASEDGTLLTLGSIATVVDGFEDSDRSASYNGKPAIMLDIYRVGDQTPSLIAETIAEILPQINEQLPEGIEISILNDHTEVFSQRANLLIRNGAMGLVLVLLVLGFFLEMRLAFWVMMGIPISFLGCMLIMPLTGLSINMITMFAFIVALGIVVDDAIVVGENVYHYQQEGIDPQQAAVMGAGEVGAPVGFSILTNIVAFIPLILLPGMLGRVMGMLPVVVISVFVISWVESLYILPAHLSHVRSREPRGVFGMLHRAQQRFSHAFRNWVVTRYGPFLDFCLSYRYVLVSAALGLLILVGGYWASGRMGFSLFTSVESDYAKASATLPFGTPVEQTEAVATKLIRAAEAVLEETGHPELVEGIFADTGRSGSHTTQVQVFLADPEIRDPIMGTEAFVAAWREKVGEIPGVRFIRYAADEGGPGSGAALSIELRHANVDTLESAALELEKELESYSLVQDINNGVEDGKPQFDFTLKPEAIRLGLSANDIGQQVRAAFEGTEVLRQQRGRNEVKVMVRLPEAERTRMYHFENFILRTPDGGEVMLADVVDTEIGTSYTTINRRNGVRTLTMTADVRPKSKAGEVMAKLDAEYFPHLLEQYPGLDYSYEGHTAEQRDSFGSMAITLPLVLLAIYALLAIPFKSYSQPLIVMASIPFGIIGAIFGHLLLGYEMTMMGVIGMLALSGVVVNDALVLISFANERRAHHASTHDAVISAGIQRFRPILLTTLTTFGGLMPMILETSRQAKFLIPMAISLGFGILFATFIALLLVPCLYMVIDDVTSLRKRGSH